MVDYREAAVALWGDAGAYAHDTYGRLRPWLYPELPESLPIVIGIQAYGHCLALTGPRWHAGPRISIASNLFPAGREHVTDVLTHEMLHAWLHVTGRQLAHESADWYAAVRRLSPAVLGRELDVEYRPPGKRRRSVRVPNPAYDPADENSQEPKTVVRKEPVPPDDAEHEHGLVARWPGSYRPDGYDYGVPIECPIY
jgi:hypothetical protein